MIIWFALIIPVVVTAALIWRFGHEVHVGEAALMLGVPTILVCAGKHLADFSATADVEFLGDTIVRAEYEEDWNKMVPCRHPKYRRVGSGKNAHTVYVGQQHAFDVDYYPPKWTLYTTSGRTLSSTTAQFDALARRFKNRTFVDMHRAHFTDDGDKYVTAWGGDEPTRAPVVVAHAYENRVQAATSVFAFPAIDPTRVPVYAYPPVDNWWRQRALLGAELLSNTGDASLRLEQWNGRLGPERQVKLFLCLFRNQPLQTGLDQEAHWKGGNKNEFVVCVGLNDQQVPQWTYAFSWSKADDLKVAARDRLAGATTPLDLTAYVDWLAAEVRARYVRRDFAEFTYLTIEPPPWAVAWIYLLTCALCGGIGTWAVYNDVRPARGQDTLTDAWMEAQRWATGR